MGAQSHSAPPGPGPRFLGKNPRGWGTAQPPVTPPRPVVMRREMRVMAHSRVTSAQNALHITLSRLIAHLAATSSLRDGDLDNPDNRPASTLKVLGSLCHTPAARSSTLAEPCGRQHPSVSQGESRRPGRSAWQIQKNLSLRDKVPKGDNSASRAIDNRHGIGDIGKRRGTVAKRHLSPDANIVGRRQRVCVSPTGMHP